MKNRLIVVALVGLAVATSAAIVVAQETPALVLFVQQHVKPGMTAEWEEARKQAVTFMREHGFPFRDFIWVSDQGVYASNILLGSWEDIAERRQWSIDNDFFDQEFWRGLVEASDHRDESMVRPRPELGYTPDNDRVPAGEEGFVRERRYYLRPGTGRAATEVREAILALFQRHNSADRYFVGTQVAGVESPMMSVFMPRRDVADWFTPGSCS